MIPCRPVADLVHWLHCQTPWLNATIHRTEVLPATSAPAPLPGHPPAAVLLPGQPPLPEVAPIRLLPMPAAGLAAPAPYRCEPEGKALGYVLPLDVGLCSVQLVHNVVRESHDGLLHLQPAPLCPLEVVEHSLSRPELLQATLAVRAQNIVAPLVLEAVLARAM